MYRCLNCGKELTLSLLNMGIVPIANHLLSHKKEYSKTYPLEVFLCSGSKTILPALVTRLRNLNSAAIV